MMHKGLVNWTRSGGSSEALETVAITLLGLALVGVLTLAVLSDAEVLAPCGLISAAILWVMWCITGRIQCR